MLHKSPSRADQDYCEEQETTLEHKLLWKMISYHPYFQHKLSHLSKDLEKMGDVVQDGPGLLMYTVCSNFSVVYLPKAPFILDKINISILWRNIVLKVADLKPHPVEEQTQTLQEDQCRHYPMDTEDLGMAKM